MTPAANRNQPGETWEQLHFLLADLVTHEMMITRASLDYIINFSGFDKVIILGYWCCVILSIHFLTLINPHSGRRGVGVYPSDLRATAGFTLDKSPEMSYYAKVNNVHHFKMQDVLFVFSNISILENQKIKELFLSQTQCVFWFARKLVFLFIFLLSFRDISTEVLLSFYLISVGFASSKFPAGQSFCCWASEAE